MLPLTVSADYGRVERPSATRTEIHNTIMDDFFEPPEEI